MSGFASRDLTKRASEFIRDDLDEWIDTRHKFKGIDEEDKVDEVKEIIHLGDVDLSDLADNIVIARQDLDAAVDDVDKARATRELGWMEALSQVMSH